MGVIDVDPELLRKEADAALFAADQTWTHMRAEIAGNIPALMKTIREHGPYGYAIVPQVKPDGTVRLPIATTYEEIHDCYIMVRGASDLLSTEAVVELRGSWYTFQESVTHGRRKIEGATATMHETAGLFPSSNQPGITGELVWARMPTEQLGHDNGSDWLHLDRREMRRDLRNRHDAYVAALAASDGEGILATYNDGVQGATRDYVTNTGGLASLDGKEAHREYYRAFFALYEVESVSVLDRAIQEWYVFAELRVVARRRDGSGTVTFHTAEYYIPARDGLFIARIGHGTDPA